MDVLYFDVSKNVELQSLGQIGYQFPASVYNKLLLTTCPSISGPITYEFYEN
jgi:hypothetical protein